MQNKECPLKVLIEWLLLVDPFNYVLGSMCSIIELCEYFNIEGALLILLVDCQQHLHYVVKYDITFVYSIATNSKVSYSNHAMGNCTYYMQHLN